MNEHLDAMIQAALDEERKSHGKRFSTHQEANACIKEHFDDAMDTIKEHAQILDFLWFCMRHEDFGENFARVKADMRKTILIAVCSLLMEYVMLEKYEAGVVHEPTAEKA